MVLIHIGDEKHPNPIWLVKALSSSNFVRTNPNFHQIKVKIMSSKHQRLERDPHLFRLGHQKGFQVDSRFSAQTTLDTHG